MRITAQQVLMNRDLGSLGLMCNFSYMSLSLLLEAGQRTLFGGWEPVQKFLRNTGLYFTARNSSIVQLELSQHYHFWTYTKPRI